MAKWWWISSRNCAAAFLLTTTTTRSSSAFAVGRRIAANSASSVLTGRSTTCFSSGRILGRSTTSNPCDNNYHDKFNKKNVCCYYTNTALTSRNPFQCRGGGSFLSSTVTTTMTEAAPTTPVEDAPPVEVFRTDYQVLPYLVSTIRMNFDIRDGQTTVTTDMTIKSNPKYIQGSTSDLQLDGEQAAVTLQSIELDGKLLSQTSGDYDLDSRKLILHNVRDGSQIRTVVTIVPETNTELSGLYQSAGLYVTQCEAMGFRRITYYPDRPDNMAVFESVRLEANLPLLLSNGNLVEQGVTEEEGRNYAIWSDPFPKPSYLFAIVAGDLEVLEDTFVTKSGRTVLLRLFTDHHNVHKLKYAMTSLQNAMKWDEDRYGLEYDLDLFNIVAVKDFNMGAMENKSLNVFNTACVLADPQTATDRDFELVESIVAHEYFHNWTGNRVTCRDWFQLTLKEGLTVFRDQEFSADMMGPNAAVKRIEDVIALRARQFAEDAGPMKHPIRPESYVSMDNFYTATVYVKGAEIIRMYQTLLSVQGFRKGMDLYFERHDGSAVTCDDFLSAMADANGVDLTQFARWYSTAGTPTVKYSSDYKDGTFTLNLEQSSTSTMGPLHIPVAVGLLDKATGKEVVATKVLDLKEEKQTFTFDNLSGEVVPSLFRGFSAPVKTASATGKSDEDTMAFLAANDTDGFNRWEACQKLYTLLILQTVNGQQSSTTLSYAEEAFGRALATQSNEYSLMAYSMMLPTESTLAEEVDVVDPIAIHKARGAIKKSLARKFEKEIRSKYDELTSMVESEKELKVDSNAIGQRRLRNTLLEYLCSIRETDEEEAVAAELALKHYNHANGLTDKVAAFSSLSSMRSLGASTRDQITQQFYDEANGDPLVINKWFSIQAMADLPDILDRVKMLKEHKDFSLKDPNRCRALLTAYTMNNAAAFHDESGESYKFIGTILAELDQINPQISSRMAGCLIQWRRFDETRAKKMKAELETLSKLKLSDDLFEIVTKGLKE